MYYFKERLIIIILLVFVIDCEQWYPATIEPSPVFDISSKGLKDTHKQKQSYLPVFITKNENRTPSKSKWHFSQSHNIAKNQQSTTNKFTAILQKLIFPATIAYEPHDAFENNSIFQNSESTLPISSQRKYVKRCRTVKPKRKERCLNETRKGRFLKVFEVVQFEHVTCTSSSGLEGTCLHEFECQTAGGSNMGSCADGYGTCCVIQFECDGRSSSPIGWFTNPDFPKPSTERISCTITLDKSSAQIKQIRLDFVVFEMLPPTSGVCEDDQFVVIGQNSNNFVPILCGINTGQHVYIEVGDVNGPIHLSVQTVTSEKRLYAIKTTQLSKSDKLTAPTGCLQYHTGDNGYLESFNYRDNSDIGIPRYPSYLNNLNYAMCIERSSFSCSITYTNAGQLQIPNYDTDGLPVIPPKQAGVEIFNCPSDWLLISAIRLCGERLNDGSILQDFTLDAPVTDNAAGPIVIWFRSDGGYVGRGFKLNYLQNPC